MARFKTFYAVENIDSKACSNRFRTTDETAFCSIMERLGDWFENVAFCVKENIAVFAVGRLLAEIDSVDEDEQNDAMMCVYHLYDEIQNILAENEEFVIDNEKYMSTK